MVDGVTVAMSVVGADRGWQRACRVRLAAVMVPVSDGFADPGCVPGADGACCNTNRPWAGRPAPGTLGA